ncbi:MAG: hypothetical protein JO121_11475, partial [Deltaproteobacteria bacterium]|nr:hypothetical protein [Deltaproteobacteria bacterium]
MTGRATRRSVKKAGKRSLEQARTKLGSLKSASSARAPVTDPAPRAQAKSPVKVSAIPPIVGIGASAGGLEAFRQLLGTLPVNTGMAFVLVQHLEPSH